MGTVIEASVGVVLLVVTILDIATTAVAPSLHGGWLSRRVGVRLWGGIRRLLAGHGRALQAAGLLLVLGLVLTWVVGLFLGWGLVIDAVGGLERVSGEPIGSGDAFYFAGYTLSTLGNGEIFPTTGVTQAIAVVASLSGLLSLTMAITYLVPVLQAASDRRVLAATIHGIGASPAGIAARLWPDRETGHHDELVLEFGHHIRELTQAHSSYPVLHFFHVLERTHAIAPNVAALDEALATVLGEDPEDAPLAEQLLYEAITDLLDELVASFVQFDPEDPGPSTLELPHAITEDRSERRGRLAAWCVDDGWRWDDVVADDREEHGEETGADLEKA